MKFAKLPRCYICLKKYKTVRNLFHHVKLHHSKRVIIKALLKATNNFIFKRNKKKNSHRMSPVLSKKTSKTNKKSKSLNNNNNIKINIKRKLVSKSAKCICNATPESSDTESCSGFSNLEENGEGFPENAKPNDADILNSRTANEQQFPVFCCQICYAFFTSEDELKVHLNLHVIRLFVCPICNEEFFFKPEIVTHMNCHMENTIFDTILNLENDYNVSRANSHFSSYNDTIASIIGFLNDHQSYLMPYNPPQAGFKINCDICYREMFNFEYESHLQSAHYVGLRGNFNSYI